MIFQLFCFVCFFLTGFLLSKIEVLFDLSSSVDGLQRRPTSATATTAGDADKLEQTNMCLERLRCWGSLTRNGAPVADAVAHFRTDSATDCEQGCCLMPNCQAWTLLPDWVTWARNRGNLLAHGPPPADQQSAAHSCLLHEAAGTLTVHVDGATSGIIRSHAGPGYGSNSSFPASSSSSPPPPSSSSSSGPLAVDQQNTCSCQLSQRASFFADQRLMAILSIDACQTNLARVTSNDPSLSSSLSLADLPLSSFVPVPEQTVAFPPATVAPGTLNYFSVHLRGLAGVPLRHASALFLWARLTRPGTLLRPELLFPVKFTDLRNGTVQARFTLYHVGDWTLEIKYDGVAIQGSPFAVAVVGSDAAQQQLEARPVCQSLDQRYGDGFWEGDKWRPISCQLPDWTRSQATHCLRNRGLAFLGDSLIRCVFWTFATYFQQRKLKSHFDGYMCEYNETTGPDTNIHFAFRCGWQSTWHTWFPNGMNEQSGPGYYNGDLVKQLQPWFGAPIPWFQNQRTKKFDDTLILSVASHDMVRDDIAAYRFNLMETMRKIKYERGWNLTNPAQLGFSGDVVWVSVSAPVPEKTGQNFPHYKLMQTFAKSRLYHHVASEVMALHGVPVIDEFQMTYLRPEKTFDGQHYVLGTDVLTEIVYMNVMNALIHQLCYNK